jgi:hypothetical protein
MSKNPIVAEYLHLIRSEYLEMPGLQLTPQQVQRLWNLDTLMCESLLAALTDGRFLRKTAAGRYARFDGGAR